MIKPMSEQELEKLALFDSRLANLEIGMQSLKEQMHDIYNALMGDIKGEVTGLIHEHRSCRKFVDEFNNRITLVEKEIELLKAQKNYLIAWVGGASFVVSILWLVAAKFFL